MRCFTIIGAGPVGTLMSLLLARRGQRVRLYERRPDPRAARPERGRSINLALSARGLLALERADVLDRLRGSLIPMRGRMLHDEHRQLQFHPYGRNERETNYAASRDHLNRVLVEAAAGYPNIELHFNRRCVDLDPHAGTLQLRDEHAGSVATHTSDSVLACDGAGSAVREALRRRALIRVEEAPLPHDYKELLIAARAAGAGHDDYAFEPQALHIWPRGGFMLIALPNTDGSFTATLFLPRDGDNGFERLDSDQAVERFFQREFADAAAMITDLAAQFRAHPQGHIGTVYCDGWHVGDRLLLLGDAAHAIVPFHGQGLNCGFEDCIELDRLLAGSSSVADAFAAFERERVPNTVAIAAMALENYVEMRDDVRSPAFARRKGLAAELERLFPERFIPRYSMVTFHPEIPYAEARSRGEHQERVLDSLLQAFPTGTLPPDGIAVAERLLKDAGL